MLNAFARLAVIAAGALAALTPAVRAQSPSTTAAPAVVSPRKPSELDVFMERVLARRDEGWRKLHDYVLDERERFDLTGPGGARLDGSRREFTWYVRDGYLIRSPLRFDGVTIGEAERRKYEEHWMTEEKGREARARERAADRGAPAKDTTGGAHGASGLAPTDGIVNERGEPRFISESFFLRFKFEPGNYYLVGREQVEGRPVVRVEYYPTRLFRTDEGDRRESDSKPKPASGSKQGSGEDIDQRIERGLNKVALVTLWIDPVEYQIVRYEFDNVDFGFLPARWLFRLDTITASMSMARVLDGVWLPREIDARAAVTLATGGYALRYGREFSNYKKAETAARVRSYGPPDR